MDNIPTFKLSDDAVELILSDKLSGLGEVRSSIKPRDGTIATKYYSAEFRRLVEVHGSFSNAVRNEYDASLLSIQIKPSTDTTQRRFKKFSVAFTVEPSDNLSNNEPPIISAYEPAGEGEEYFQEHVTNVTKTRTLGITLTGKPPVGAEPSVTGSTSTQRQFDQRELLKLKAKSFGKQKGKDTTVFFELSPAFERDGIGDSIAIALIIKRARGTQFYLKAVTNAKVSHRLADSVNWTPGKDQENVLRLGPFESKDGEDKLPAGVDASNLEAASDHILKRLAYVHLPEKGTEKLFLKEQALEAVDTSTNLNATRLQSQSNTGPIEPPSQAHGGLQGPTGSANIQDNDDSTAAVNQPQVQSETEALKSMELPYNHPSSCLRPLRQNLPLATLNSRAVRHRAMAQHYQFLAQLHLEEAAEAERLVEAEYLNANSIV